MAPHCRPNEVYALQLSHAQKRDSTEACRLPLVADKVSPTLESPTAGLLTGMLHTAGDAAARGSLPKGFPDSRRLLCLLPEVLGTRPLQEQPRTNGERQI